MSWGHVRSLTELIDANYRAPDVAAGGRVAVVLSNRPESIAALLAILRAGRTLVTISPLQPPERLSADLAASPPPLCWPRELWGEGVFSERVAELGATGWSVDPDAVERDARRPVATRRR